jgi:ABC-2 type transport system ATP-binding protein
MAVLEVSQVTKRFGDVPALNGIDIVVEQGEVYGFIGPNGAGKTTTNRILLGILQATSGTSRIGFLAKTPSTML